MEHAEVKQELNTENNWEKSCPRDDRDPQNTGHKDSRCHRIHFPLILDSVPDHADQRLLLGVWKKLGSDINEVWKFRHLSRLQHAEMAGKGIRWC